MRQRPLSPPATWPIPIFCSRPWSRPLVLPRTPRQCPKARNYAITTSAFFQRIEYARHNASSTMAERKIGRRACNGCKIRKVKCSEVPPCKSCISARIECTFTERRGSRGPKSLRPKTLMSIAQTQRKGSPGVNDGGSFADESPQRRMDVSTPSGSSTYVD